MSLQNIAKKNESGKEAANAMKGDRERFMEKGMNDYMTKPVKIDSLLEILEQYRIE